MKELHVRKFIICVNGTIFILCFLISFFGRLAGEEIPAWLSLTGTLTFILFGSAVFAAKE